MALSFKMILINQLYDCNQNAPVSPFFTSQLSNKAGICVSRDGMASAQGS